MRYCQLLIIASLLFGCSGQDDSVVVRQSDIQLKPVSYVQWQEQLSAYVPDIVVVDMWAMWCVSCIERFPKMVEMHQRYQNHGVQFVSMNLDDRHDQQAIKQAKSFLTKQNAVFDNYLMDENLFDAFEQLGLIGIPAVIIYDRQGKESIRLTGDDPNNQFTDEDIEIALAQLLADK